jgi:hypothetical protein
MPDDSRPERASEAHRSSVELVKIIVRMIESADADEADYETEYAEIPTNGADLEDDDSAALQIRQEPSTTKASVRSQEERQADAWGFMQQFSRHMNTCGFPHNYVSERFLNKFQQGLPEPGAINYLVAVPYVEEEWDRSTADLAELAIYLSQVKGDRFRVLADIIEDGDLSRHVTIERVTQWRQIDGDRPLWLPLDDERRSGWLERVSARPAQLTRLAELWDTANEYMDLFATIAPQDQGRAVADKVEFLLDDLIPMGVVTLLAGASETGKTTLLTELAVSAAMSEYGTAWLGRKVDPDTSSGAVIYLSAEDDSPAFMQARRVLIEPQARDLRFVGICGDHRPIEEILQSIGRYKNVSLLIVDPAREYLRGGESDSAAVSALFSALQQFARNTGCAVVLVHHLSKGATPNSLAQLRRDIRGSQVWVDRPRQILGMFRRGGSTIIGTCKNSAPPPSVGMPETVFRRDEATLRYLPVEPQGSAAAVPADHGGCEVERVQDAVLALVRRFNADGRLVRRTGNNGVFNTRAEEIAGITQRVIKETVDRLVRLKVLDDEKDAGLKVHFQAADNGVKIAENDDLNSA